jgi:hypothetical protein
MDSDSTGDPGRSDWVEEPRPDAHVPIHHRADWVEEPQPDAQAPIHHPVAEPFDFSYRIVTRTVLWVIVGAVFVGFAIWWALT